MTDINVKKLKNLKQFYFAGYLAIDSTLLSDLEQLKEIHLDDPNPVSNLFDQKRRFGPADLKIYLCGLCLIGPDDPAIGLGFGYFKGEFFAHLTENASRLADQIPFCTTRQSSVLLRDWRSTF